MDIKQELDFLIVYAKCQQISETSGDADAAAYHGRFVRQSIERINRWADVAEAAMAYAEYQYDTDHGELIEMGDYIGNRGQLWHRFVKAREKAMT